MRQDSSALGRRTGIERATLWVGLGLVLFGVLPVVLGRLVGHYQPTIDIAMATLFRGGATYGRDSWAPIGHALRHLAANGASGLYEATYYHSAEQFIYSPLSLAFCQLTQWPPLLDWTSPASLNRFFRYVLFGNVVLVTLLFEQVYRTLGPAAAPPSAAERAARIAIPVVAGLLFFPLLHGYWLGNIQTGLTFLIVLSLLGWLRGQRAAAGVCLGLVCIFKPAIAPVLLWGLVRREFGFVAGFLGVIAAMGAVSLAMYGWGVHQDYLDLMSYLSKRGESFYASHSINSLLNRAVFNGPNLEWDGTHSRIRDIPWIRWTTTATSALFIVLALVGRKREQPLGAWLDYALALLCIALASPVVYEHHLGFTLALFAPAALMLSRAGALPWLWALGIAYLLMANLLQITDRFADTHWNVLQSYRLFSALMLLAVLYRLRAAGAPPRRAEPALPSVGVGPRMGRWDTARSDDEDPRFRRVH